ncbi:fibronectin type III-like domain-contianing protein [Spirillospora sp. NPDC048819]|uniref:fibronectin type III-like domain-contianing protein n=1 Tax=Spirillospora sp. NPDC048819 TaxID=3155268 RepID=UPI0033F6BAE3
MNEWIVECTVANTGERTASEVVQLYVAFDEDPPTRPRHELRGFAKVELAAGAGTRVSFTLTGRDIAWWSVSRGGWRIDAGGFAVEVGASSRDIRLRAELTAAGDGHVDALGRMSTLGEWLDHPVGGRVLGQRLAPALTDTAESSPVLFALARGIPLAKFSTFGIGLTTEVVDELVTAVHDLDGQDS